MQHLANIPLDAIQTYFSKDILSLEIKDNLNVYHLISHFSAVIPWISHLIIKDCQASPLKALFSLLKENRKLATLHLYNCEVDDECLTHLLDLQKQSDKNKRIPLLYLFNLKHQDPKALILTSMQTSSHLIPELCENEQDFNDLNEFERQVLDDEVQAQMILKNFDEMRPFLKKNVVLSIWHSVLMDPKADPITFAQVSEQVRGYIEKHPHHPALLAAVQIFREEYEFKQETDTSF